MPHHAPLHLKIRVDKSKGDIGLSLTNNPSGVGVTVCGLTESSVAALVGMEARAHQIASPRPRPPRPPRASPASAARAYIQVKRHALWHHPYRGPIQVQHEIVAVNRQEVNDHGTAVAAMDKATRWGGMVPNPNTLTLKHNRDPSPNPNPSPTLTLTLTLTQP